MNGLSRRDGTLVKHDGEICLPPKIPKHRAVYSLQTHFVESQGLLEQKGNTCGAEYTDIDVAEMEAEVGGIAQTTLRCDALFGCKEA